MKIPSKEEFCGTIADFAPRTSPMIPGLVIHCINEIERRGFSEEGIYRTNGSQEEIDNFLVSYFSHFFSTRKVKSFVSHYSIGF